MRLPDILEHKVNDKGPGRVTSMSTKRANTTPSSTNGRPTRSKPHLRTPEAGCGNTPRKQWALCVPYTLKGDTRPLYPDLLILRREDGHVVVDLLDPHDPGRDDAASKAAGLASYAEHHGHLFGRIRLIAKVDGDYRQLDFKDPKTRKAVKAVTTSHELKTLYTTMGIRALRSAWRPHLLPAMHWLLGTRLV